MIDIFSIDIRFMEYQINSVVNLSLKKKKLYKLIAQYPDSDVKIYLKIFTREINK